MQSLPFKSASMKKILLLCSCLPLLATAQNMLFSARLGAAGYHGDLKPASRPFSQLNFYKSIGVQYDLSEHLAARSYFSFHKLRGDDKKGSAEMQQRNLNFTTRIVDWELTAQYNLFSLNNRWWTPYFAAGIGIFHFNPYTRDAGGNQVFLQPLSTEGQGFQPGAVRYRKLQFSLPLAVGASYSLGEDARVGIEAGYRKLFTDHLDDVSTAYVDEAALRAARGQHAADLAWRGDEHNGAPYPAAKTARGNDAYKDGCYYVAVTFTLRYWFDKYKQIAGIPGGGGRDKKVGCPASRVY